MAYIDDIVVFSRNFQEHLNHLTIVITGMKQAGLTFNPRKVQLASPGISLLCYVVDGGIISPSDDQLKAITEFPVPGNVRELQWHLGMVAFHRQFIANCAVLSQPLNQLLHSDSSWSWEEKQQTAFRALSQAMANSARLYLPDLNRPFAVHGDTSDYGMGAVLLQEHDAVLCPVAFASRTLNPAERNYSITEKE